MEGDVLFERSLDDVTDMITHAKLIESDLKPLSQIIRYFVPVLSGYVVTLIVIHNSSFNTDPRPITHQRLGDKDILGT